MACASHLGADMTKISGRGFLPLIADGMVFVATATGRLMGTALCIERPDRREVWVPWRSGNLLQVGPGL
jgi:hypothetical protein